MKVEKMTENKKSTSLREILYFIAMSLLLATKGIGLDESETLFRICFVVGTLFMVCKMLFDSYCIKEILFIILLSLWGLFSYYTTGSLGMLIYVILLVGIKKISIKQVFYIGMVLWAVCMLGTASAAIFGERKGVMLVHEKFGLGPILRESLGYTHPNVLHITYVVFMAFVLYNCQKKGKELLKVIIFLLLGDAFVFMYSLSTTGLLMSFVYLAAHLYFVYRKKMSILEKAVILAVVPLCVVISIFLPFLGGDGTLFRVINNLFNNRLLAIRVYYFQQGLSLFGARERITGFSLDNSFASALIGYGCIAFAILMFVYYFLVRYCLKKEKRAELAIICAFLIGGISEPFLFNASIKNITVFFIGRFLYDTILQNKENGSVFSIKLSFFSKMDREIFGKERFIEVCCKIWNKGKAVIVGGSICFMAVMGVFIFKPEKPPESVYVNENLCDCNGKLILVDDIKSQESAIFIGNMNAGENVYYFNNENSNLIRIMELRKDISSILYIGIVLMVIYCEIILKKFRK